MKHKGVQMIAMLNETVLWWHWIVLGIALLIVEMNSGTFIMLGLGIAAVVVGVVDVLLETEFTTELTIWMVLSVLAIAAWFTWVKEPTVSDTGQSNYALDTAGTAIEEIAPHQRGKVAFDAPVLGNSTWHATAKEHIAKGARVKIVDVNGQLIEVAKV